MFELAALLNIIMMEEIWRWPLTALLCTCIAWSDGDWQCQTSGALIRDGLHNGKHNDVLLVHRDQGFQVLYFSKFGWIKSGFIIVYAVHVQRSKALLKEKLTN